MRKLLVSAFVIAACIQSGGPTPAYSQDKNAPLNSCVSCHSEAGDELALPVEKVKDDVHGKRGLSCASCHGGNPNEMDMDRAMDPAKGFVGRPNPKQVESFCGKCHSNADTMRRFNPSIRVDQETEYRVSVHGKRIDQGDSSAATCISCHTNHGIQSVKDPTGPVYPTRVAETCGKCHSNADTMKKYSIPTDQAQKYGTSVHAEALIKNQDMSAPTCNDCHGNHGATPPGISSIGNVCGSCHGRQAELFAKSPHKASYEAMGISECVACHSNHAIERPTDEFIGTGSKSVCLNCHDKGDAGYQAAGLMRQRISDLDIGISSAEEVLGRAARAGMEVSKAHFALNDAKDSLVNSRVVIHNFSPEELEKAVAPGLAVASKAQQAGEEALDEQLFRRKGLVVSLFVIALAAVSIYLKIRQIEGAS